MGKRTAIAVLSATSLMAGVALGWWLHAEQREKSDGLIAVVRSIEVAGLCANALGAAEDGRVTTLRSLLEMRLTSAVNEAAARIGRASTPGFPVPNLIEGLEHAQQYAVSKGMRDVAAKCQRVLEFLARDRVRA